MKRIITYFKSLLHIDHPLNNEMISLDVQRQNIVDMFPCTVYVTQNIIDNSVLCSSNRCIGAKVVNEFLRDNLGWKCQWMRSCGTIYDSTNSVNIYIESKNMSGWAIDMMDITEPCYVMLDVTE